MGGKGRVARGGKSGEGEEGGGKERASCYTPRVCFSTSRHGDPLAFVTVMGWENSGREALESLPRLSGTPALTIILLKEGKNVSIRRDFADSVVLTKTDF